MNAEWFIKEQLNQLPQSEEMTLSLLPTERTVSPVGSLRYSCLTYSVYVSTDVVTVDVPVFFADGAQVLRAQYVINEYLKYKIDVQSLKERQVGDISEPVLRCCYAILSLFLKTIFLHTVETGIDYSGHRECLLTDTIGVLRHFNQWVVDKESPTRFHKHTTDLLSGYLSCGVQDHPFQLSYTISQLDGRIAFHLPGAIVGSDGVEGSGWISLCGAPYQGQLTSAVPNQNDEMLTLADYRLLYRAGSGRNISHWEMATETLAVPTLAMLIK